MNQQFTNIVAYAKRTAICAVLNETDARGLIRRGEVMGIDALEAARIVRDTTPARRVNPRTGEVVA